MGISIETAKCYELGLYEKAVPASLSWKDKLQVARETGYDFFEMSIDESDEKLARLDMSNKEILELQESMLDAHLSIRSMCLSGHRKYPLGSSDPDTEKKSLIIMGKSISFAVKLGIRIIMLAGYDVYYEQSTSDTVARFEKNLDRCVEMASKAGIVLAFETMETPFMDTVGKAMFYVRKEGSPFLAVYPDIGNINNAALLYHMDVWKDLKKGKRHLVGLHLKETRPGKYRNMLYGEGVVDFPKAIQTSWELGVRRYVTEFWYLGNEDWKKRLVFAHDKFAKLLDTVQAERRNPKVRRESIQQPVARTSVDASDP